MSIKVGAGLPLLAVAALLFSGCIFGGGGNPPASISRPGSIPTATIPANLPAPIVLGDTQPAPGSTTTVTGRGGTYVVKSGDTLGAIAAAQNVPPEQQTQWTADVLRLNGIADARLLAVGQELTLPAVPTPPRGTGTPATSATAARTATAPPTGSTLGTATPTRPAGQATPAATTPAGASGRTYTVVSGDSPNAIGAKLNVPNDRLNAWSAELLALNNATATSLNVGQVLQLPASTP